MATRTQTLSKLNSMKIRPSTFYLVRTILIALVIGGLIYTLKNNKPKDEKR